MIELVNLHKSFGEKYVLRGVNLAIPNGKTTCVIGKSGCGKSVLLKHIVRLLEPDDGKILVDGMDVATLDQAQLFELRQTMGFVFQGAALFDSHTVYENIIVGLWEHGHHDKVELESEARKVLSAVGLLPDIAEEGSAHFETEWQLLKDKAPSDLSGGMRKRVGVARALVGSPKYIFYDEPTSGLDPVTSEQIDNLIADLAKKLNVTSLVITHDMFSVFRIADEVALIDQGLVRFTGTAKELQNSPDAVVQEFIARFM